MTQFEKIYFDMDGVLADFRKGVKELCGVDPPGPVGDDPAGDDAMYGAIRRMDHFYAELEPVEGMVGLFREIRGKYGDRVEILTAVPWPERNIAHAAEDKREWVRRYLGGDVKVNIVLRKEKKDYARGEQYILIDDTVRNLEEWKDNGGCAIHFTDTRMLREELYRHGIIRRKLRSVRWTNEGSGTA